MRPDLPWNVAGISSEAREAARAAARREGLSVGEWLTRRIVAGVTPGAVSEVVDMSEPGRNDWLRRPEQERQRRDSDAMLDRVSKSETETADIYRRIEEQLRSMARRLDASERSQTESNRVMSKAAVEMNIAAREQAQAFDQLGVHVANLSQRLDRVEEHEPGDGLRDAVKALHQGLSRLADQISQTASQSATQISALAGNIENVAGRVGQARQDSLAAVQALENRFAALDERVRMVEAAAQANTGSLNRALDAIEGQKRAPSPMDAIVRLEDSVRRLEDRGADPNIDRRLTAIERTLSDVVDRIEQHEEPARGADRLEDTLQRIVQRLESLESAQHEAAAELRRAAAERTRSEERARVDVPPPPVAQPTPPPPVVQPAPPPPVAQPAALQAFAAPSQTTVAQPAPQPTPSTAGFGPLPSFEPPPFAEVPPPPFASVPPMGSPYAAPPPAAPFADNGQLFEPAAETSPFTADITAEAPATVESYLAAARRSARAAAQQEAERSSSIGGLRWGSPKSSEESPKRTRPLMVGLIALVAIAVIAGAILSRQVAHNTPASPPATPFQKLSAKVLDKQAPPTQIAASNPAAPVPAPPPPPAAKAAPKPTVLAAKTVTPAHTQPAPAQAAQIRPASAQGSVQVAPAPQPVRPVPTAPLDKLTAAANAGNARAELIVGLKYLEGDGVPTNDGEAAKWLAKAAEAGEPVAQYRLGTLFERGRGVGVDPAKAARWYLAAANQGSRKAMHNLAVAYAEGNGVKKDFAEASRWFLRAANLGLSDSQFNLAVLYERGYGVPQNLVDAYKWYAIAAAQGDAESKARIGTIASQLDNDARAAAQHAADTFRPGQLNARANVAPTVADVTRG